jgi:hypothetical protein
MHLFRCLEVWIRVYFKGNQHTWRLQRSRPTAMNDDRVKARRGFLFTLKYIVATRRSRREFLYKSVSTDWQKPKLEDRITGNKRHIIQIAPESCECKNYEWIVSFLLRNSFISLRKLHNVFVIVGFSRNEICSLVREVEWSLHGRMADRFLRESLWQQLHSLCWLKSFSSPLHSKRIAWFGRQKHER